jgi:hypothetical protein
MLFPPRRLPFLLRYLLLQLRYYRLLFLHTRIQLRSDSRVDLADLSLGETILALLAMLAIVPATMLAIAVLCAEIGSRRAWSVEVGSS